jgi:sulfate permease, SulP family
VGPVALVSLLVGALMDKYGVDYVNDPMAAVDFAAQVALCTGLLTMSLGLFNLGNMVRFISHPVLSGFTTAAAMIIGMNQVRLRTRTAAPLQ